MKKMLFIVCSSTALFLVCTPAVADLQMATAKNCMACHAVDKKLVGPSFKNISAKYADRQDANEKLEAIIMNHGGFKSHNSAHLPAERRMTSDESQKLSHWILRQK